MLRPLKTLLTTILFLPKANDQDWNGEITHLNIPYPIGKILYIYIYIYIYLSSNIDLSTKRKLFYVKEKQKADDILHKL